MMMRRHFFLPGDLQAIAGRHDSREFVVAAIDRSRDRNVDAGTFLEAMAQLDDPDLGLLHVGNELPVL